MSRQHDELPSQLTLDGINTPAPQAQTAPKRRPEQPRSIGWARCPYGRHPRLTGVYYDDDLHLVFRDHLIRLNGGGVLLCRGSGQPVPDNTTVYE